MDEVREITAWVGLEDLTEVELELLAAVLRPAYHRRVGSGSGVFDSNPVGWTP